MLERTAPCFYGKQTVTLGKSEVLLHDVNVGKEFVLNGRIYQTTVNRKPISAVAVGVSFRHGETWFKRVAQTESLELNPNMPFGDTNPNRSRMFDDFVQVAILEITCRGDA